MARFHYTYCFATLSLSIPTMLGLSLECSAKGNKTKAADTFGRSIKLGRAVEMSPSVFKEQFTSWDSISQAASADSLLLSTLERKQVLLTGEPHSL